MDNTNSVLHTERIVLKPVGDAAEINRVKQYIRDGCKNYNMAKNEYMTALYVAKTTGMETEDLKELKTLFTRIPQSKKGSGLTDNIQLPVGLPAASTMARMIEADFGKACREGLLHGLTSLPTYKVDAPIDIHVDYIRLRSTNPHINKGLYHQYESDAEFQSHLFKKDLEIFIDFANDITFRLVIGDNIKKSQSLRCTLGRIFDSTYEVCGSKIQMKNGEISLLLCIKIPVKELDLDENISVGVNLGMTTPAYCALNTTDMIHESVGSVGEYYRVTKRKKEYINRLKKDMTMAKGGHGRSRKLRALENFSDYEHNWRTTFNHVVSKSVVDFAVRNKAKYINLEDLTGYSAGMDEVYTERKTSIKDETGKVVTSVTPEDKAANNSKGAKKKKDNPTKRRFFFLKNWPYYQLQSFITYKAAEYGIQIRYVDPAYDSQTCSYCGHYEDGQRSETDRKQFICKNPACKMCGTVIDADFNAARNVALSNEFIDRDAKKKEKKAQKAEKAKKNQAAAVQAQAAIDAGKTVAIADHDAGKKRNKKAS